MLPSTEVGGYDTALHERRDNIRDLRKVISLEYRAKTLNRLSRSELMKNPVETKVLKMFGDAGISAC